MNNFMRAFFTLDLWIALSLITTMVCNILFGHNQALMITISIACGTINALFCVLGSASMNFYKRKEVKKIMK